MIISHKWKFIFIKTQKTAGTSIEAFLSRFCGDDDVITPFGSEEERRRSDYAGRGFQNYRAPIIRQAPAYRLSTQATTMAKAAANLMRRRKELYRAPRDMFWEHMGCRQVKKRVVKSIWESYFKFCFERDPWEKQLSLYYFFNPNPDERPTPDEWVVARAISDWKMYTIDDRLAVDFVGRYERLEDDLRAVAERVGLPCDEVSLPGFKTSFRKEKKPAREVFSRSTCEMIAQLNAKEIAAFGYRL